MTICYPNAVEFRLKPFLQADGVPACSLPYALRCAVSNVVISSIKIDKLSQGCRTECRTGVPELATAPAAICLWGGGKSAPNFWCFNCANINKKVITEHSKMPLSHHSPMPSWMPLLHDLPLVPCKASGTPGHGNWHSDEVTCIDGTRWNSWLSNISPCVSWPEAGI